MSISSTPSLCSPNSHGDQTERFHQRNCAYRFKQKNCPTTSSKWSSVWGEGGGGAKLFSPPKMKWFKVDLSKIWSPDFDVSVKLKVNHTVPAQTLPRSNVYNMNFSKAAKTISSLTNNRTYNFSNCFPNALDQYVGNLKFSLFFTTLFSQTFK